MSANKAKLKHIQIIALIAAAALYLGLRMASPAPSAAAAKDGRIYVERAIDGDTLKLSDGSRVRLIGIDTPELHYSDKLLRDAKRSAKKIKTIQAMGKKAALFTRQLCEGKAVRLEFDVDRIDRYRRLLAYVYLEDGTFINARILEEGYAQVLTVPPNVKYADHFLKLQQDARNKHKGLWNGRDKDF